MKIKLHIARWIARRIEKRNRIARRALRDHRRQEGGQIRRDEKRARGLRLYIAWSHPTAGSRRSRAAHVPSTRTTSSMGGIIATGGNVPQAAL